MKNEELSIVREPLGEHYIGRVTDLRLLRRLLSGSRFAHWNNAEIGSHTRYNRRPTSTSPGFIIQCVFSMHEVLLLRPQ